jgi:hypothetical protein
VSEAVRSILLGTSGLGIVAIAALLLSASRAPRAGASAQARRVGRIAAVAVAAHGIHFIEEWRAAFGVRFPELLGLTPWPGSFLVAFNVFWIVVWIAAIVLLRVPSRVVLFPIWFLAIASAVNGVAHPLLSLAVGGYFPGLWSSPVVGVVGIALLLALGALTRPSATTPPSR